MTGYVTHGIEHYHKAALILLDRSGGSIRLEGTNRPYEEFHDLIKRLLRDEDYEPFNSGHPEPRWRNRFRWALKHMRQDGRVKYFGSGQYEISDSGRAYLGNTPLPIELLTEEVERLDNGDVIVRWIRQDGEVEEEFLGRQGTFYDEEGNEEVGI